MGFVWTGHDDKLIRQWTTVSGEKYREMKGHRGPIICMTIMDKYLFSGSKDGFIYQWDLVTGDGVNFMPMTRPVMCMSAWPEQDILLAGDENGRTVYWDWKTGPTPTIVKEVYSAQQQDSLGRTFIAPTWAIVYEKFRKLKGVLQGSHPGWIFAAVGEDRVEQRFIHDGKLKRNLMHPARVVALSTAQQCVFTACRDRIARAWDVNTGGMLQTFMGHRSQLLSICSHPQEELHTNHDLSKQRDLMRPGTMTGTRYLFTGSVDGGVVQWKIACRGACRHFAQFLEETKDGTAGKVMFQHLMKEVGIVPIDPFEAQRKAEENIQAKMDALDASMGASYKEEPEPPPPKRVPKMGRKKKKPKSPTKSPQKKNSKEELAYKEEMIFKKQDLSKLGYASQMALMGFVNDVSQDFVARPPQRHFPGRGVSVDDHATRYELIKSGWDVAADELMEEWKLRQTEKRLQAENNRLMGHGDHDEEDSIDSDMDDEAFSRRNSKSSKKSTPSIRSKSPIKMSPTKLKSGKGTPTLPPI